MSSTNHSSLIQNHQSTALDSSRHAVSTEHLHSPPTSRNRKRKRRQSDDGESVDLNEAAGQLSHRNVRKLSRAHDQDLIFDWMEMESSVQVKRATGTKARSCRSRSPNATSTVTETSTSRSNTCSNARYRFDILTQANIHIEIQPPSDHVQARIDVIIDREIPSTRQKEITRLARDFCDDFARVLRKPAGEDDCVELLYKILSIMDHRKRLALERKARMGSDQPIK